MDTRYAPTYGIVPDMPSSRLGLLYQIAHQVALATEAAGKHNPDALLTLADLARLFNADREVIKKAVRVLQDFELLVPMGLNPKRYRFDTYQFKVIQRQTVEDEDLQTLIDWLENGPPTAELEAPPSEYRRKRKRF